MLQIKRILFPTDDSVCAEHALSHAAYLADQYEAELHVLNVVEQPEPDLAGPRDFSLTEQDIGEALHLPESKQAAREEQPGEEGAVTEVQVRDASAAVGILHYAAAQDVDLIVMGTHGRRGVGRLLMGSVAEKVVRLATVPVFTVSEKEASARAGKVQSILVPVDFSAFTQLSVTYGKELASAYNARLDLLHVIEEAALPTVYGIEPVSFAVSDVIARTREALTTLLQEAEGVAVPFQVHVLVGHAARSILDFAADHGSDLIVMASHGRSGIKHFLLGSVTEKVVRMAPCPVFTVKSFGKSLIAKTDKAVSYEDASETRPART